MSPTPENQNLTWEEINTGWDTPAEGVTMSTVSNAATQTEPETTAETPAEAKQELTLDELLGDALDVVKRTNPKLAREIEDARTRIKGQEQGTGVEEEEQETREPSGLYERTQHYLLAKAEEWKSQGRLDDKRGITAQVRARVYQALHDAIEKYCSVNVVKVIDRTISDLGQVKADIDGDVRKYERSVGHYERENQKRAKSLARLKPDIDKLEGAVDNLRVELDRIQKDHYTAVTSGNADADGLAYREHELRGVMAKLLDDHGQKAQEEENTRRALNQDNALLAQYRQEKAELLGDSAAIMQLVDGLQFYMKQLETHETYKPSPTRSTGYREGVGEVFKVGTVMLDRLKKQTGEEVRIGSIGYGLKNMLPQSSGDGEEVTRDRILQYDQAQFDRFEQRRQSRQASRQAAALQYEARTEGPAAA